jgi:hypothetical protein
VTTLTVSPTAPAEEEHDPSLRPYAEPSRIGSSGRPTKRAEQIANIIVLAILFGGPALMCVHAASASDFDLGWHLRTGEWIMQHHAVPQTDPFSGSPAGKPWQAYSWLFEVLLAKLFQHLGLVGIVAYTASMVMAVTVALYSMVKRLQGDFSLAVLFTFIAGFSIAHLDTPRPWMFTILFFALELNILMQARRTGRVRELAWLPVIFCLWANLHIEYIDGLLVLGLAFAESIAARRWSAAETRVKPGWMGAALLTSVLATLVNPYGWRIYSVVFNYGSRLASTGSALNKVSELQAIPFRDISDFLILALAMASAGALAWQRRFVLFETCLLIFAAFATFRSQRDIWLMAIVSVMILAPRLVVVSRTPIRVPRFAPAAAVVLASLAIFAGFRMMRVNNAFLENEVENTLPANAVKAILAKGYTGLVYDDYNWGGYLVWALRQPVTMDGRASFYGDERIDRALKTWTGEKDWASDPNLKAASIVIGPTDAALTQLLRTDQHYQLVYEDKLATVFVARKQP